MPGDVSQRLSNDEKIGAAIGTCSVIRQDLEDLKMALGLVGVMAHCEDAPKTTQAVFDAAKVVERDLEHLALLDAEIGPFLSQIKEVTVKNERAAGSNVTQ